MPDNRLPGECEVGERLQYAADPQTGRERVGPRHIAARKPSDQQRHQSNALDDRRVFIARETKIHGKRPGHHACERIGELEQHHKDESDNRDDDTLAEEEILEGANNGRAEPAHRIVPPVCVRMLGGDRLLGLPRHQRGNDADHHQRRHHQVARVPGRAVHEAEPLEAADQEKGARARDQHADAVGRHIGRHAGGLFVLGQALNAKRVNHDVLGGGRGRDQQRPQRDRAGSSRRIAAP